MWKNLLYNCGIPSSYLTGKHGPCPLCGGKDRFRYTDVYRQGDCYCNQCYHISGIELIKEYNNISFREAFLMAEQHGFIHAKQNPEMQEHEKLGRSKRNLKEMFQTIVSAKGTQVQTYLENEGLFLPKPFGTKVKIECGIIPNAKYYDPSGTLYRDAMVWKMLHPETHKTIALHRTFLKDGQKDVALSSPRKETPRIIPLSDIPFKIIPLTLGTNNTIILAEGIETALAAYRIMKEIYDENCTTVAVSNAHNLSRYTPNERHQNNTFLIFADRDVSLVGQIAALRCAQNIYKFFKSHNSSIIIPSRPGVDWRDLWKSGDISINSLSFEPTS